MPCCATAQACRRCLAGLALASSSRNMFEAQEARPGGLPVWSFTGATSMLLTCCAKPNARTARSATWAGAGWNLYG